MDKRINIALDGPAGAGKSTVATLIAQKLGILHLDTGAMYRATALYCLRCGVDCQDQVAVEKILPALDLNVHFADGKQQTSIGNEDVSQSIRTPQISSLASIVSVHAAVRIKMVEAQQQIAMKMSCVLDGRDVGTHILPDCPHKFFVTASAEERAKRRQLEENQEGQNRPFEVVLKEIIERDERDKSREFAPLRMARDAVLVDTTAITAQQAADFILARLEK